MTKKSVKLGKGLIFSISLIFVLLFLYLGLNLSTVEQGYKVQELSQKKNKLNEEIDKLEARKAQLLNLVRVENVVRTKLGYQYPDKDQFIKVFEEKDES